jgi:hypothetical protein
VTGRAAIAGVALCVAVGLPAVAEARIVDLRLSGNAGGMFGWGTSSNAQDMFREAAGPGFGVEAGLKLLIFDLSVNVLQIVNGDGLGATLIQGMLGVDVDIPAGHAKLDNGQSVQIVHTGAAAGFVLGTNAPAMLPVTNDQLADKGFSSRFRAGYEYFLNPFMGVGATLDFGYHYLLGGEATVNQPQDHSSGLHIIGLASFTFHLGR